MYSDKSEISVKNYVFEIIRALIAALIITLAAVLVAALAIKFFNVPDICAELSSACYTLPCLTSFFRCSTASLSSE